MRLPPGRLRSLKRGLAAFVDGGGYAYDGEGADAFSRHDYLATIDFDSVVDRRVRIDWSLYASGLGSVLTKVKRLGNIGGPSDPSEPIFDLAVNAYIDPISDADVFVQRLPVGKMAVHNHVNTSIPLWDRKGFSRVLRSWDIQ